MPQYFGQLPTSKVPWSYLGPVRSVEHTSPQVNFECEGGYLQVSVLAANLVRVRFSPDGKYLPRRSWAVTCDDNEWQSASLSFQEAEATFEIETEEMRVVIEKDPCRLACFDRAGKPFAVDAQPAIGRQAGEITAWKQIEPDEHFYGFGERTGLLDKLSERKTNWTTDALDYDTLTDAMYQAIPFMIALRPGLGYGVFCNSTHWSEFDLGAAQPGTWHLRTEAAELDYYLIYGPRPARILETYTALTGRMPLPPLWALGYHQCRWSYSSDAEVRVIAQEFRTRQIPCDVIHIDIDYMRGYRVFTWSPERFGNPALLIGDLADQGFKAVAIVDPGVKYEPEANYPVFDEGIEQNYFVRKADGQLFHGYVWPEKAVFPDFLRPEVREWWSSWHRTLIEPGIAGIWNDMNEPAIDDRPFGDNGLKVSFPLDAPQGPDLERTTHAETHNLYGLMMARSSREALESLRPSERSFVLTRSGFAGVQRYASVWMGDNQSLWEHLEQSLPMLCNMGLSGVGFVGADIGGFAGNATAELFARWMQVGMLYPLMRGHSALKTARHEPWEFGETVEGICREYIELRYRLLPYIYTLFWEATTTGAPILRPLLYHFPEDLHTYQLYDQVLLGPSLMAAPVYRPGVEYRAVYLPEGTWYDWWSGEAYTGPLHILAHAPLERMPLYVRAGAVIPMTGVKQYTDGERFSLTLRIWPGTGEWISYEDDGHSFDFRQGQWATTTVRVSTSNGETVVEVDARVGQYPASRQPVTVELADGRMQQFIDDGTAHRMSFPSENR